MYPLSQVFLVMPFMHGGELFHHINNQGLFLEEEAAFYIAEVTLALEHLHMMGVIHRDLKPVNKHAQFKFDLHQLLQVRFMLRTSHRVRL